MSLREICEVVFHRSPNKEESGKSTQGVTTVQRTKNNPKGKEIRAEERKNGHPGEGGCDRNLFLFLLHWIPLDVVISRYEITFLGRRKRFKRGKKVERKIDTEDSRSNQGTNQGPSGKW